jgi:hypothetical protein
LIPALGRDRRIHQQRGSPQAGVRSTQKQDLISSLFLLPLSQPHSRAATVLVDELDAGGFQARAYAIGLVTGTTSATESTPVRATPRH